MKKYQVSRIVMYTQTLEIEANSEDEAIEKAKKVPAYSTEKEFLEDNSYEIVEQDNYEVNLYALVRKSDKDGEYFIVDDYLNWLRNPDGCVIQRSESLSELQELADTLND